jgi:hypothetical protein
MLCFLVFYLCCEYCMYYSVLCLYGGNVHISVVCCRKCILKNLINLTKPYLYGNFKSKIKIPLDPLLKNPVGTNEEKANRVIE